jgi:type IV pilus assembly protein PilM
LAPGSFAGRLRPSSGAPRAAMAGASRLWRVLSEPERPHVAVEVRPSGVGVVRTRVERRVTTLAAAAAVEIPPDVVRPSLTQPNLADPERFRAACRSALERGGVLGGAPIALVLPDPVARIAVIPAAELPGRASEMDELVRFRLRKSLPFDVREARVALVRPPRAQDPFIAVAALGSVIDAYEEACRSLGLEPGLVELSGLALCRAGFGPDAGGDRLLVNWEEGYATLILVRDGWPVLARTLTGAAVSSPAEVAREAAQTLLYARERLGSAGLAQVLVRAVGVPAAEAAAVLETSLGVAAEPIDPWRALGTSDPGPAAQALAGAAACLGAAA